MHMAAGQIANRSALAGARAGYRPDIDGLRAIAVTSVVLFHAGLGWLPGGFAGVDIFFVISGFLIGGIVHHEITDRRFSFTAFYVRRARRILPALIAVSLATLGSGLLLLGPSELSRFAISAVAALLGVSNLWFFHTTDYFTPSAVLEPFLMTWSLGIEEQFYLLLPPLLLVLRRWSSRSALWAVLAITCLSLMLGLLATPIEPVASFYLLPTRAWELGIGVSLAIAYRAGLRLPAAVQQWIAIAGLVAIAASLRLFDERILFPGYAALLPTVGTAMMIAAPESGINRHLLGSRPLVAIGLISYSWYLWHWPPLALLRIAAAGPVPPLLLAATAIGSIVPAYCCWRWIELPWRHPRHGRTNPATLRRYGVVLALCLALFAGVALSGGIPDRAGASSRRIESILTESRSPCLTGYGVDRPNAAPFCAPPGNGPLVALLGDSHASALGDALREDAQIHGYGLIQMTAGSCPPLLGATLRLREHPGASRACADFNIAAIEQAARDTRIKTVVLTAFWQSPFTAHAIAIGDGVIPAGGAGVDSSSDIELRAALGRTLARLRGAGKKVVLLGDVPWLRFDPARHVWAQALPLRGALERYAAPGLSEMAGSVDDHFFDPLADRGSLIVADSARAAPGTRFVRLRDLLCPNNRCRTDDGEIPLFIDQQHLSRSGADYVVRRLNDTLWD
jgi:peptidoglycan/LPS O-acetylase OafA/YrhL